MCTPCEIWKIAFLIADPPRTLIRISEYDSTEVIQRLKLRWEAHESVKKTRQVATGPGKLIELRRRWILPFCQHLTVISRAKQELVVERCPKSRPGSLSFFLSLSTSRRASTRTRKKGRRRDKSCYEMPLFDREALALAAELCEPGP